MNAPLIFVVAPAPATCCDHLTGGASAGASRKALHRFRSADLQSGCAHPDLGLLAVDGRLTGEQRRSSDGTQLLCDALVVQIEPQHRRLGVCHGDPSVSVDDADATWSAATSSPSR